ncbi:MAG: tetratricopeptide repeat protein, partial [Pseudomonadota bacterium]
ARFYWKQGKPLGTILRLEAVLQRFSEGVDPQVMLMLGESYLKANKQDKAKETFAALIKKHPNAHHSKKAKRYLKDLAKQRD